MFLSELSATVSLLSLVSIVFASNPSIEPPPIVDLGYALHQAQENNGSPFYNFSNIRFAEPPIGDLRFREPVPPRGRDTTVSDGSFNVMCPQAFGNWITVGTKFAAAWTQRRPFDFAAAMSQLNENGNYPFSQPGPAESEDCLFLDVVVPKDVFDASASGHPDDKVQAKGAPVLVWIFGGGFVAGHKREAGTGAGLVKASRKNGSAGIVYVAINYRLGAFGWLAGPTLQNDGTANAGLYDQRLALEWVQKNIHLFGGDPNQVTIMGESAGGASVMHQITAFGGSKGAAFQRAIPQSPGWLPISTNEQSEHNLQTFLSILKVSSVDEARTLSSDKLIAANAHQVGLLAPYYNFIYGPAIDGVIVPANPGTSLLNGSYVKDIRVMAGHNTNEGVVFTQPDVLTDSELESLIRRTYPAAGDSVINYILTELYPPVYDGSYGYSTPLDRTMLFVSETTFLCNDEQIIAAFNPNETYAYHFAVPPALHADDTPYTFYDGDSNSGSSSVESVEVAEGMQNYITNFVMSGDPNGSPAAAASAYPKFEPYGTEGMQMKLNSSGIGMERDTIAKWRCRWWQEALWA